MEKNVKLGINFIRFQYMPHLLLVLVFCLGSGFVVSFRNLAASQSAKVMEMYVIFIGILLFTPLFMPEQDREIWQLEQSRKTPMWQLYSIRILLATVMLLAIVSVFVGVLWSQGSEIEVWSLWSGSVCEILFLGSIGFAVSGMTNQVILGYMAAVMYYAVNIGNSKIFGPFALFQMSRGNYDFRMEMLLITVVLLTAGIVIRERRSK